MEAEQSFRGQKFLFCSTGGGKGATMTGNQRSYRRLAYRSVPSTTDLQIDLPNILAQSRANNGMDGITGFLWASPARYVQLLEGPSESVGLAFSRIERDPRHSDIQVISDDLSEDRLFPDWTMAAHELLMDMADYRVRRAVERLPDNIRRWVDGREM